MKFSLVSDITNYCNAYCYYCCNNWDTIDSPCNMPIATHAKLITTLPLCGSYFFSCGFEPTIHPQFKEAIQQIPLLPETVCFFTTNLVKRLSDDVILALARSNLNYINISFETLDPATYKKVTGVSTSAFHDNIYRLVDCFSKKPNAPDIVFITMILSENHAELLRLAKFAAEEFHPKRHEFRTPFLDVAKINPNNYIARQTLQPLINSLKAIGNHISIDSAKIADQEKYEDYVNGTSANNNIFSEPINQIFSEIPAGATVALRCGGRHTEELIVDLEVEQRDKISYIIDNNKNCVLSSTEIPVVNEKQADDLNIDVVIISSYFYGKQLLNDWNNSHIKGEGPKVIELYEELEKKGFCVECQYYNHGQQYKYVKSQNQSMKRLPTKQESEKLRANYYRLHAFSNGRIGVLGENQYYNIDEINSPIDFFANKLTELQENKANKFSCTLSPNSPLQDTPPYVSEKTPLDECYKDIHIYPLNLILYDQRFLLLSANVTVPSSYIPQQIVVSINGIQLICDAEICTDGRRNEYIVECFIDLKRFNIDDIESLTANVIVCNQNGNLMSSTVIARLA